MIKSNAFRMEDSEAFLSEEGDILSRGGDDVFTIHQHGNTNIQ